MDTFTRNYSIVLGAILLAVLSFIFYEDPLVSDLNDLLEQDKEVVAYPYEFRVIRVQNGVASMSTPRSSEFPAYRILGILFPHLVNYAQDDPEVMEAQQELAKIQKQAKAIVIESGEINRVRWELDKNWLSQRGVQLNPGF